MAGIIWPADAVAGAPSYTGRVLRQLVGAMLTKSGARLLGARTGVHPAVAASVASVTSTTWTVLPHSGHLDLEATAIAGAYSYAFAANETGAVNAANVSNPRVDSLFIQLSDPAEADGTAAPLVTVVYAAGLAGTLGGARGAAGGPPAFPNARCMEFAQLNVPVSGGGSPTVTFVAPFTVAAGGVLPCRTSAEYPVSPYVGQYIDDAALGLLRWNGTAWVTTSVAGALLGETVGPSSPTTMAANGTNYVPGSSSVTVVLATQRRVRVVATGLVNQNTTTSGDYRFHPAYNTGATVVGPSGGFGNGSRENARPTLGLIPMTAEGTVLLTAGTYTFYPVVARISGGTGSDNVNLGYVAVYDAGPT